MKDILFFYFVFVTVMRTVLKWSSLGAIQKLVSGNDNSYDFSYHPLNIAQLAASLAITRPDTVYQIADTALFLIFYVDHRFKFHPRWLACGEVPLPPAQRDTIRFKAIPGTYFVPLTEIQLVLVHSLANKRRVLKSTVRFLGISAECKARDESL